MFLIGPCIVQSWYWHLVFWARCGRVLPFLLNSFVGETAEGFVSSIWFLLSKGRLQLGPVVAPFQIVQGGQPSCFCQVAATLPYCCNFGWSAPPPARWGNSVLGTTLSPTRLAQWPAISHFRGLACHPTPTLSTCSSLHLHLLRVRLLAPPRSPRLFSVPPYPHCQW
jgi:hypothetical protein